MSFPDFFYCRIRNSIHLPSSHFTKTCRHYFANIVSCKSQTLGDCFYVCLFRCNFIPFGMKFIGFLEWRKWFTGNIDSERGWLISFSPTNLNLLRNDFVLQLEGKGNFDTLRSGVCNLYLMRARLKSLKKKELVAFLCGWLGDKSNQFQAESIQIFLAFFIFGPLG